MQITISNLTCPKQSSWFPFFLHGHPHLSSFEPSLLCKGNSALPVAWARDAWAFLTALFLSTLHPTHHSTLLVLSSNISLIPPVLTISTATDTAQAAIVCYAIDGNRFPIGLSVSTVVALQSTLLTAARKNFLECNLIQIMSLLMTPLSLLPVLRIDSKLLAVTYVARQYGLSDLSPTVLPVCVLLVTLLFICFSDILGSCLFSISFIASCIDCYSSSPSHAL